MGTEQKFPSAFPPRSERIWPILCFPAPTSRRTRKKIGGNFNPPLAVRSSALSLRCQFQVSAEGLILHRLLTSLLFCLFFLQTGLFVLRFFFPRGKVGETSGPMMMIMRGIRSHTFDCPAHIFAGLFLSASIAEKFPFPLILRL